MPSKIDLTGQKFGRLIVIKEAPRHYTPSGRSKIMWYCNCNCGQTGIIVSGDSLRSGTTKSCGCLARDLTVQRNKQARGFNQYDLSGDYGVGYTSNGTRFIFDKEDYHKIYPYRWNVNSLNYITAHDIDNHCKTIYLHRLILNLINDDWKIYQVDHINRIEAEKKYYGQYACNT